MATNPTYRTEGQIERFDERDTVFSREGFVEGSPEEIEYHSRNPELAEIDRRLAGFIKSKMEDGIPDDQVARAIYESHFISASSMALPGMVDGEPAEEQTGIEPFRASKMIKGYAEALGADDVRIGPLRPEWIYSHRGTRPFFTEGYRNPPYFTGIPKGYQGARYGERIELAHKNAVTMAFGQDLDRIRTGVGRAVDFEVGRVYAESVLASVQLARFIRSLGYPARAHHMRNYLILAVPVAVDSGIGELARTGYLVSRKLGANFRLSTVTTDMPLKLDDPVDIGIQDFCEKCRKCARLCPSGAIESGEKKLVRGVWKWKINPEACLSYWNKAGYTCSICQAVCPWTKPQNIFHRSVAALAVNLPALRKALVIGDDLFYGRGFRPENDPEWIDI